MTLADACLITVAQYTRGLEPASGYLFDRPVILATFRPPGPVGREQRTGKIVPQTEQGTGNRGKRAEVQGCEGDGKAGILHANFKAHRLTLCQRHAEQSRREVTKRQPPRLCAITAATTCQDVERIASTLAPITNATMRVIAITEMTGRDRVSRATRAPSSRFTRSPNTIGRMTILMMDRKSAARVTST